MVGPVQMFFLLLSFSAMAMLIGIGSLLFKFCILNPVEAGVCRYFLLSLSFIGWYLLAAIAAGLLGMPLKLLPFSEILIINIQEGE